MKIARRTFLQVSFAGALPLFLGRASELLALEGKLEGDEILLVVQLSGGNDGLSTVIPYGDDEYHKARPAIRVEGPLKLDEHVGLHPALEPLSRIFGEGRMAIVQGVSYPNPNRSHFKSMDIWHTADLGGRAMDTGWLGRSVDACCQDATDPNLIVNLGGSVPYSLRARLHKAVSFQRPNAYLWRGNKMDEETFRRLNRETPGGEEADWVRRVASAARASSREIRKAASEHEARAEYPRGRLGQDLRTVAGLISGGLPTRVFHVTLGGFDTHVRQKGRHDALMREFGGAIAAFQADLAAHGAAGRVITMAFSEFGRRVEENASGGTDHGVAGPMLLFGEKIRGGIYGSHPSLTDLDRGDLKMAVDFRSVYATLIDGWLGTSSEKVLGARFPEIPFLSRSREIRLY